MTDETILLVDNDRFQDAYDRLEASSRFIVEALQPFSMKMDDVARFGPRRSAETDASVIQPIAYCVIRDATRVLCYRRRGNEGRLHGKASIGIGGHVSEEDCSGEGMGWFERTMIASMRRELSEEIGPADYVMKPRGLIYDPSNEVGRHHFGLLYLIDIEPGSTLTLSDEIREPTWLTEFPADLDEFETWSRIALERLRGELFA